MSNFKRGDFSFVWLFAIFAGIAILLLAIYGAIRIGETSKVGTDASIAKQITLLTDPLEAGFTAATFGRISFNQLTVIKLECNDFDFGESIISANSKSNIGDDFSSFVVSTSISDKYIFGRGVDEGETFHVLSKSFNFPYKIADFLILISENNDYCFIDTPSKVKDEIEQLDIPVVFFENCSDSDMIEVCFDKEGCEISVFGKCEDCRDVYSKGIVRKGGRNFYYVDSLIYPAIFSDKEIYDCNVNRLIYRGHVSSIVLGRKASLMNARGCTNRLESLLYGWSEVLEGSDVGDLLELYSDALDIYEVNRFGVCNVW